MSDTGNACSDISDLLRIDTDFQKDYVESKVKCIFCCQQDSKYTCPRCNMPYCSVDCFKSSKHAGCSESFYKDCFLQEMKSQVIPKSDKLKVMKMIEDLERNFGDEDDDVESLQKRLENVDLNDEDTVWSALTAEEKAEFHRSVDAGSLVNVWTPWWLFHDTSLIVELDVHAEPTSDGTRTPPDVKLVVPKLSILLNGKAPSTLVSNNLVEILYIYAYYNRKYNGGLMDFTTEVGCDLISASKFLLDGITRPSLLEALQSAMENCQTLNKDTAVPRETIEPICDVYHILIGPQKEDIGLYVKASIAECHRLLKVLKQQHNSHSPFIDRKVLRTSTKKLQFLYAWVEQYAVQLPVLAMEVYTIYKSKRAWYMDHEIQKAAVDRDKITKTVQNKLVEEIS